MAKPRYVIRLHKTMRKALDRKARQEGYLTPTLVSKILESEMSNYNDNNYEIFDEEGVFQLKSGGVEKGKSPCASKQMSIYLTPKTFFKIQENANYLKATKDKSISSAYIIRDVLYNWICKIWKVILFIDKLR